MRLWVRKGPTGEVFGVEGWSVDLLKVSKLAPAAALSAPTPPDGSLLNPNSFRSLSPSDPIRPLRPL